MRAWNITWLKDAALQDLNNLPSPEIIARETVDDLTAVLAGFEAVAAALAGMGATGPAWWPLGWWSAPSGWPEPHAPSESPPGTARMGPRLGTDVPAGEQSPGVSR